MKIVSDTFRATLPALADNALPDGYAVEAIACKLSKGNLAPFNDTTVVSTPTKSGIKSSIYLWNATHTSSGFWFHWTTDVDAVRGPVAGDTQATTYYTGDGIPKRTDATIATSSGTDYPTNSYTLGVPAPATQLDVEVQDFTGSITGATNAEPVVIESEGHGLSSGNQVRITDVVGMTELNSTTFTITVLTDDTFSLHDSNGNDIDGTGYSTYTSDGAWTRIYEETDLEDRVYVYTYVSANEEEGPPSDSSLTVSVGYGQSVALANIETAPTGNYNITKKRIYRTATVSLATSLFLVAEIDIANTTYTDSVGALSLGNELPSMDWDMPPDDMEGLIELDNGVLAAFSGNQVCFSEPYQPHAWPTTYRKTLSFPIVGLGSMGNSVVAITEVNPHIITGVEPRVMTDIKMDIDQGCVSKRGIVSVNGVGVAYPSPDGLIFITMSGHRNITADMIGRDEWQALEPTSFDACLHNGKYYCFYDNGSTQGMFSVDPNKPEVGIVFHDVFATACYVDHLSDTMYLQVGEDIVAWDSASTKVTYRWKSKEFMLTKPVTIQAGTVEAESYDDLTFRLYVDGTLKHTEAVTSDSVFRMPGGYLAKRFQVELEGTDEVKRFGIAQTASELAYGNV
jgi:hypothetical protein